jgi:type II secretory pathway predicted ATPase ExeA
MSDFEQLAQGPDRPFSLHPRTDRYYPASSSEEARQRLGRIIQRGSGPGILIGATGTGKSLMLRVLAEQFEDQFCVAYLACGQLATPRTLLQAVLFELGLPYRDGEEGELRLMLLEHLRRTDRFPGGLLLLIDEAHTLPPRLLEELRMLTNIVIDGQPRARIVLAGSSALEEAFASPELESFSQRLAARCYLAPMNHGETTQYIRAQLAVAGIDAGELLADDACDAIFEATDGVPRLVNQLCDNALLIAVRQESPCISRQVVQEAWSDLQQLPVPWAGKASTSEGSADSGTSILEFGSLSANAPTAEESDIFVEEVLGDDRDSGIAVVGFTGRESVEPIVEESADNWAGDSLESAVNESEQLELPQAKSTRAFAFANLPPAEPAEDPFHENFAEEEIILDAMAGLELAFGPKVPRVKNLREVNLSSLVVETLEDMGQSADWNRPEVVSSLPFISREADGNEPVAEAAQALREVDLGGCRPTFWTPPGKKSRESDPFAYTAPERHVLVIEDSDGEPSPTRGGRPQNYRQLFARLRGM